jgi:hypothetical protein
MNARGPPPAANADDQTLTVDAVSLGGSVGETIARSLRLSNRKLRGTGRWVPQYQSAGEGWRAAYEWFAGAGRSTETAGIEAERMVACPADEQSFLGRLRELLEGAAGR